MLISVVQPGISGDFGGWLPSLQQEKCRNSWERAASVNVGVEMFPNGERSYLKRAFSAPRIWTVEAGYLARLVNDPACDISLAPTCRGGGGGGGDRERERERAERKTG